MEVRLVGDYLKGTITEGAKVSPTGLPSSNVLYYRLTNEDVIVARPSGTEPKIKFYYLLLASDRDAATAKFEAYKTSLAALAAN